MFTPPGLSVNQKGIAHLLLIALVVLGIGVGLYLVKNPAIFDPKAATDSVNEWGGYGIVTGPPLTLTASPNPCILGANGLCTSTITWDSKNADDLTITIRENPGSLFAKAPSGSTAAPWISANGATFDAYSGGTLIGTIFVKGVSQTPDSSSSPTPCTAVTSWNAPYYTDSCSQQDLRCDKSGGTECVETSGGTTCTSSGVCRIPCSYNDSGRATQSNACPTGYTCEGSSEGTVCTDSYPGRCTTSGFCQPNTPSPSPFSCRIRTGGPLGDRVYDNANACPAGYYCEGQANDGYINGSCKPYPSENNTISGKLSARLQQLAQAYSNGTLPVSIADQNEMIGLLPNGSGSLSRMADGKIVVEVRLQNTSSAVQSELTSAGAEILSVSSEYRNITLGIHINQVNTLANVEAVEAVREVITPSTNNSQFID